MATNARGLKFTVFWHIALIRLYMFFWCFKNPNDIFKPGEVPKN